MGDKELYKLYYDSLLPIYGERESSSCARMLVEELTEGVVVEQIIADIKAQKPMQQIIGHAWFYGSKFKVNEHVLIPRGETEELVDWIVKDYKGRETIAIVDVGTGSGVIAISLAGGLKHADVTAIDVSEEALKIAEYNSRKLGHKVRFLRKDILKEHLEREVDVVVSNPPYITRREMSLMCANVLDYEPHLALFVEDDQPLIFYKRIAALAKNSLREGGALYFEINENYGMECCEMLKEMGYKEIILRKDLNDRDRMIKATK